MDYILSGDPREVEKVLRENKLREQRGWISFTPCSRVDTADNKYVVLRGDDKKLSEPATAQTKTTKRVKKSE